MKTAILSILFNFTLLYAAEPNPIADFHARLEKALAPTESLTIMYSTSSSRPYFAMMTGIGDDYKTQPSTHDPRFDVLLETDVSTLQAELLTLDLTPVESDEMVSFIVTKSVQKLRDFYHRKFLLQLVHHQFTEALDVLAAMNQLGSSLTQKGLNNELTMMAVMSVHTQVQTNFYMLCSYDASYSDDLTQQLLNHPLIKQNYALKKSVTHWLQTQNKSYQKEISSVILKYQKQLRNGIKASTKHLKNLENQEPMLEMAKLHAMCISDTKRVIKQNRLKLQQLEALGVHQLQRAKKFLAEQTSINRPTTYQPPKRWPKDFPSTSNPIEQAVSIYLNIHDSLIRNCYEIENLRQLAKSALLLKIQPNDTTHLQNLINAFDGKPMTLDLDRMVVKIEQLPNLEHFTKGEPIKRERWDYFPLKLKLETPTE